MSELSPLSRERLAAALRQMDVHYLHTDCGALAALFAPASATDLQVEAFFAVGGPNDTVLDVHAGIARAFGPDDWPGLLASINDWHREHRWPTGHLDYLPARPGQPPLARLIAEHHTPLAAGIHDELLVETLAVALDCCIAFLHHLCPPVVSRVETVSAGQLEDWLTER
jgi:hypothetical protein